MSVVATTSNDSIAADNPAAPSLMILAEIAVLELEERSLVSLEGLRKEERAWRVIPNARGHSRLAPAVPGQA